MMRSRFFVKSLLREVTKTQFNFRPLSSSGYVDPGWMIVSDDPEVDPARIKIPVLTDIVRQEIYQKFKEDPEKWTIPEIANHYGCTHERAKAVIYLLQKREEMMKENNVMDIPAAWTVILEKHQAEPLTNTVEALAEEYVLPVQEITDILKRMKMHKARMDNLTSNEEDMEEILHEYREEGGVDTSFKETPKKIKSNSIRHNYSETLFGDDGYEETKYNLLKRIERETRCYPIPDLAFYLNRETAAKKLSDELAKKYEEKLIKPSFLRCKIAFKDLNKSNREPIIIRCRDGKMRAANPLEEAGRSWNRHPNALDMAFHKERVDTFRDPDGDDARAYGMIETRRNRHRRIKAELAAAALAAKG